ncbi:uncharacterized protein [Lolium perenne]|uniref:uncharacterized protein n=1 Tax=Lolium perenne TaxID=4522 RepID=UPI003A999CD8
MAVKSETNGNKKDRSGATNKGTMATQEGIACTTIGGNHKDATIETNQTLLARKLTYKIRIKEKPKAHQPNQNSSIHDSSRPFLHQRPTPAPPPLPTSLDRWRSQIPSSPSQLPPLPPSKGSSGESRPRPLCRSPLPSITGIAGRITDPPPPSLGDRPECCWDRREHPAPTPYLTSAARDHGGRVSASSSTSPPSIASRWFFICKIPTRISLLRGSVWCNAPALLDGGIRPPASTVGSEWAATAMLACGIGHHRLNTEGQRCWEPGRFQHQLAVVTAGARMPHHQSQFGFDGHVSPQHYAAMAHGVDSYHLAARHLVQGGSTQ